MHVIMLFTYNIHETKIQPNNFQTTFLKTFSRILVMIYIYVHIFLVGQTNSCTHDRVLRNISFLLVR